VAMSKMGHEATNHFPSFVIKMGRGTFALIVGRIGILAYKDFTFF
jgi:hypothetical protein